MDYGHELQFGVFVTPEAAQAGRVLELAQTAELAGLDLVTFQDHPYQARFLDTWTLLSVVAAQTSTIRVAPNVANLPLRQPVVLARSVASLDLLSGGRVELGLGAGAFWDAIAANGGPRLTPGQAVDALAEAIAIIRGVWDPEARSVTLDGEHYRVRGAKSGPAPAHPVELWLGAYKPRMLALTGAQADGWLPSESYAAPDALPAMNARIDAAARAAGRPESAIRRLYNINPGHRARGARRAGAGARDQHVHPRRRRRGRDPALRRRDRARGARARRGGAAGRRAGARGAARRSRAGLRGRADARRRRAAERRARVGRRDPPRRPAARSRRALQPRPAGRRPAPDRRPRHAPWRARPAARPDRPGRARRVRRRRRPRLPEPHDDPPEPVDARRLLHVLLPDRRRPPHARGPERLPAPAPPRPAARRRDRPARGGARRDHGAARPDRRRARGDGRAGDDGVAHVRAAVDLLSDALLSHLSYEERELVEPLARASASTEAAAAGRTSRARTRRRPAAARARRPRTPRSPRASRASTSGACRSGCRCPRRRRS